MTERIAAKWSASLLPGYAVTTAKKLGLKGKSRPKWEASGDYGHHWGSAVHELLDVCHKTPQADLRPTALRLTADYHLGTNRVDELLATVQAVVQSDIWRRAQQSACCFSELPFETTVVDGSGLATLVRGVIDLIFQESDGWVVVDYKTDDITEDQIPSAIAFYRDQLTTYAEHWTRITGERVASLGLYFTRLNRFELA